MAELTAQIELKGVDRVSPVLSRVASKFRATAGAMGRHNARLAASFSAVRKQNEGLIRTMRRLGVVAAAVGGVAFVKGVKAGAEFQTAMADLSAITGIAGKDLDRLRQTTLQFSTESILPATKVAEAFKLVASAKSELIANPEAFNEVTKQVILLSNASGISLPSATRVAVEAMNQFNAEAKDAGRFVNVLAAGSKIGASEVNETGAAILKTGVAAQLANLNFEQTNALIQVLAKNGLKGSEAGTQLRNVLNRLAKSGKDEFDPAVVGLSTALENLGKANLKTTELMELFGEESAAAGSILIKNRKTVADWTEQITGTAIAQEQAAIRMRTFAKQAERLKITVTNALIRVFDRLQPKLNAAVTRMAAFFENLDDRQIESFARKIGNFADAVGNLFNKLGGLEGIINKAKLALVGFITFKVIQTATTFVGIMFKASASITAVGAASKTAGGAVLGLSGAVATLAGVVGTLSFGGTFIALDKLKKKSRAAFNVISQLNPVSGLINSATNLKQSLRPGLTPDQAQIRRNQTAPAFVGPQRPLLGQGGAVEAVKRDVSGFVDRVAGLAREVNSNLKQQQKPQNINMRVKIDSPVPARVTGISGGQGVNVTANTGQILP